MPGGHTASPALGAKWAEVNIARRATAATAGAKRPLSAKEKQCSNVLLAPLWASLFSARHYGWLSSAGAAYTPLSWENALLGVCWGSTAGCCSPVGSGEQQNTP